MTEMMNRVKTLLERFFDNQTYGRALRAKLDPARVEGIAEGTLRLTPNEASIIEDATDQEVNAKLLLQLNKDDLATSPQNPKKPQETASSKSSSVSARGNAMKTYSLNEVLDDIKRTTGIDVEIDSSKTGSRYSKLYSKFAETSLKFRLPHIEDEGVRKRIMGSIMSFLDFDLGDPVLNASETLRQLDLKFRSGNRTDIDRVFITKREWEAVKDELRIAPVQSSRIRLSTEDKE